MVSEHPRKVLAVVVVYQRPLAHVAAWPVLQRWTASHGEIGAAVEVMVYDNSPVSSISADALPPGSRLHHNPANGGTAAAYSLACRHALASGHEWILLLDQDTIAPEDLLTRAWPFVQDGVAAVLPRVLHGDRPVSPSWLSPWGNFRPWSPALPLSTRDTLTGIASGALVRTQDLAAVLPMPAILWLDFVDHWICLHLQRGGRRLAVSAAVLQHDLSIEHPERISLQRLSSILQAERFFFHRFGWRSTAARRLRLLMRAWRLRRSRKDLSRRLLSEAFGLGAD